MSESAGKNAAKLVNGHPFSKGNKANPTFFFTINCEETGFTHQVFAALDDDISFFGQAHAPSTHGFSTFRFQQG